MPAHFDRLTIGLGKAAAVVMFAYFTLEVLNIAHNNNWAYLLTPYGMWYLVEVVGFVAVPALFMMYGVQTKNATIVRGTAIAAAAGVILNRLDVCIVAFNWHLPWKFRYYPTWMEVVISITIIAIGLMTFRAIINRMPVLHEHPDFPAEGH